MKSHGIPRSAPATAATKSSGGGVQRGNLFQEVPPLAAGGIKKTPPDEFVGRGLL